MPPVPLTVHVDPAVAAAHQVAFPVGFELVPIVVAAVYGVLAAREHKLDIVGAVFLASTCALGGGLLRDIIMQVGDVYILNQPLAIPLSVGTALTAFMFPQVFERKTMDRLLSALDIFSVGLFAVFGADKALAYGFDVSVAITMGFFTGVGGGMMRDVFLARVCRVFIPGKLYSIAAIGGAAVYTVMIHYLGIWNILSAVVGVAVCIAIRWASIRFDIQVGSEVHLEHVVRPIRYAGMKTVRSLKQHNRHRTASLSNTRAEAGDGSDPRER